MRPISFFWLIICAFSVQTLGAQDMTDLPVRKVVLYKNGIGSFQHQGEVEGNQTVEITLPSSQLDDVLKSLTVFDMNGGRISGVTYDSMAPLSKRLNELPIDPDQADNLLGFLNQIRGAKIGLETPRGLISGRLLSAELRTKSGGPNSTYQVIEASIFTESGEIRVNELESVSQIKLLDSSLREDVARFLDLINSNNQKDIRRLRIGCYGSGVRNLFVSYTSEAPIWKTTYRIVLDSDDGNLLQGWAIVDNTTPMEWNEVTLSLVAGAPVSFIQKLSQPIYGKRLTIPVSQGIQVSPEIHGRTMREEPEESGVAEMMRRAAPRKGAEMGYMADLATAGVAAPSTPALSEAIQQSVSQAAQGREVGDQFEYEVRQPVTIGRNQSALLPIVQSPFKAEKVSIYNETQGLSRPRLAVWMSNSTGQTLDGGAFTVIESDSLAGEGLFETIQPGERRLLSYALDLGLEVTTKFGSEEQGVERVVIQNGVMRLVRKRVEARTYTIRNSSDKEKTLLVEHPVRKEWELVTPATAEETSANNYRFRVGIESQTTSEFKVTEQKPQQAVYQLSNITSDQINLWVRQRVLDDETESVLRQVVDKKAEISNLDSRISALKQEEENIFRDQQRVRDNVNRLGASPEEARLRQRYVSQLESQEDRLAELRAERSALEENARQARQELNQMLRNISFSREF